MTNISRIGLKRPVTVARRNGRDGHVHYDLVCGQGRLEAYKSLGQTAVPAIVIDASREDLLLMSLIENLARRKHTSVQLAKEIAGMKKRGYGYDEIAARTDLDVTYVRGIVRLLNKGEDRLLHAVEQGTIPISIAISIASSDDEAIQRAMTEAYENRTLRGKALLKARRLIDERRSRGKGRGAGTAAGSPAAGSNGVSSEKLLKAFHRETARQRLLVRKAKVCETRLLFIVSALKSLFQDGNLINLLRAESLDTLPHFLAEHVNGKRE